MEEVTLKIMEEVNKLLQNKQQVEDNGGRSKDNEGRSNLKIMVKEID